MGMSGRTRRILHSTLADHVAAEEVGATLLGGGAIVADADAATVTLDMGASNRHTVTLGGNRTIALANFAVGQVAMVELVQDATGSRTVTWPSIRWAGGTEPTLATDPGKADLVTLFRRSDGAVVGTLSIADY